MCWFIKFTNLPMVLLVYDLNLFPEDSDLSPYVVSHAWFFHFPSCYSLLVFLKLHLKGAACFSFIFPYAAAQDSVHTVFSHVLLYRGLTRERYLLSVVKLLKVVLMLYGLHILCIFSDNPFTLGMKTVFWVLFTSSSCIHQSQFLGAAAMYPG